MPACDVTVIGAGLAGLQCARLLAEAGRRVLLVDRKRSLAEGVHTTGIFVRRSLEDFDLPEDCLGPAVRHVVLYSPSRRPLPLASPRTEFRVGRMQNLYQRLLERCRATGVEIRLGTRFFGLSGSWPTRPAFVAGDVSPGRADKSATTNVRTPAASVTQVALETAGRRWTVQTRYLVGADGADSRVAAELGLSRNREWIVGVEDVYRGVTTGGPPRFHCFLDSRLAPGYIAWLVEDGREAHVGVGGYPSRFQPAAALEEFTDSLTGLVDLSGSKPVERRGGRIPVGSVLRRIANPRGLLVGDAAGAVSPLTAGGLDPCLRLTMLAAEVIDEFLRTGDPRPLRRYDGRRFRRRFRIRRILRRLLAVAGNRPLLEAACFVLRRRPFRRIAQRVFFGRGSFPDVSAAGAKHGRRAGLVPAR